MMYQRVVNGCATSVGRQIKRAEGGQIYSTTFADAYVMSMKKNTTSACNLRGVVSHHLSYHVSEMEKDMYNWIEWIIMRYLPLSNVDCPMTHHVGVCWKPICLKQLRKQIEKLALRTKQQKTTTDGIAKQCINHLEILSGTSVSCEQLFSIAKFILTDTRKSMSPSVFESILLLKVNWTTEWDALSVGKSMGKNWHELWRR